MGGASANPLTKGLVPDIPKAPSPGFTEKQKEEALKKLSEEGKEGTLAYFAIQSAKTLPELEDDSAATLAKQRALEERLRKAAFTGLGRKATIATSARGVTTRAPTRKRALTGI
jgi:hypothetical protein